MTLRFAFRLGVKSPAAMDNSRSRMVNFLICSQRLSCSLRVSTYPAINSRVVSWRASSGKGRFSRPFLAAQSVIASVSRLTSPTQ